MLFLLKKNELKWTELFATLSVLYKWKNHKDSGLLKVVAMVFSIDPLAWILISNMSSDTGKSEGLMWLHEVIQTLCVEFFEENLNNYCHKGISALRFSKMFLFIKRFFMWVSHYQQSTVFP